MRKSLVLALVLVFAIAGATFAAPSFSGNVSLTAETDEFVGAFELKPSVRVDADFAEEGENWTADVRLRTSYDGTDTSVSVARYRGVFNAGDITATIANGYNLGHVDTPFQWVRVAGNPGHRLRVTTDLAGVGITAQLQDNENLYLRAQTALDAATIGSGMILNLDDLEQSSYTGYLTTSFDIVNIRAIVGTFQGGDMAYAVGFDADLTEQLNVGARYSNLNRAGTTKGFFVEGTFTEGLIQAKASFAEEDSALSASLRYRGSEDNVAFGDLFDEDEWYNNVAPAFGVSYSSKESAADATIRLDGVFPAADNFVALAYFEMEGDANAYGIEGRLGLTDKTTINPYFSNSKTDVTTIGANLEYAVGEDADITLTAQKEGNDELLKVVYSIDF